VKAFFDSNILIYTATADPRRQQAAACLSRGGYASVQVLNEFVHVARRKLKQDWQVIEFALQQFRLSLDDVVPVTLDTHTSALALGRSHGFAFFDALIVAAAIEAGCDTLYSEDLQDGRRIGELTIVNPFVRTVP